MVRGPTAPESNPTIEPQNYQPSVFPIADITRGKTTTITMTATDIGGATVNPNYVVGQLIRLLIPFPYGMQQISTQKAYVLSVPSTFTVVVDIDSREYNPFISSPTFGKSIAQISAVGDINSGQINTGRTSNLTYIPGSFINISS